jgi:EmrB/QacA subfamily drug resistance transporter
MSSESPSADPQVDYSHKWWVLLSMATGTFLSTIDGSIVNVALPTLESDLHTNFATVQWVVIGYLLVVASLMLGVARLADMIGKKHIYMTGMAVFVSGSALCGLAPSINFLIAFRVFQGCGAVMIQALGMGIVTENFPHTERGRALGVMGTFVSLGISLGPTLGGLLIGTVGWRAIFLVNLPVGMMGLLLVHRFVPDWRPPGGQRFDFWGAVIVLVTLLALALGLTLGPDAGWSSTPILALLFGSLAGMLVFVAVELYLDQPMIDTTLFHDPLFSISLATTFMVFIVMAGQGLLIPFYLEEVKGLDPTRTGLFLTVVPAALGLTAPLAGILSDRYGSRGIVLIGLVVIFGACLTISTLKADTSTLGYVVRLLPLGFGVGLFQSPNNSAVMGAVPRERLGLTSGLLALTRNFGQATGIPLIGAIYASRVISVARLPAGVDVTDAPPAAIAQGVGAAFTVAGGLIVLAVALAAVAFWMDRRRARAVGAAEIAAY